MKLDARVTEQFQRRFGEPPRFVVRGPGRVNLIGEHTAYNDGFVLPMASDRATWIALRPRNDARVVLHAFEHPDTLEFNLTGLRKNARHWGEYPKGVAWALQQAGHSLRGWEGVAGCDVPMGAGLSSSASFELAVARAFAAVSDLNWDPPAVAKLCQRAENDWVGMNCGIMDQLISACGRAGHALLIDCRSLSMKSVQLPGRRHRGGSRHGDATRLRGLRVQRTPRAMRAGGQRVRREVATRCQPRAV